MANPTLAAYHGRNQDLGIWPFDPVAPSVTALTSESVADNEIKGAAYLKLTQGDFSFLKGSEWARATPVPAWRFFLDADFIAKYNALWATLVDVMSPIGGELPVIQGQPFTYWVDYGVRNGVVISPELLTSSRAAFLQPTQQEVDAGRGENARLKVWLKAAAPAKAMFQALFAQIGNAGSTVMEQANTKAANASALLRATEAVASLGLSELQPLFEAKWGELKGRYTEFRAQVDKYNQAMNDPRVPQKVKDDAAAEAGPVISSIAKFFGGDNQWGLDVNAKLQQDAAAQGTAGLGFLAALPAIWAGVQLAALAAGVALLVYALAKMAPLISVLFKFMVAVNNASGGMLFPVLILGGAGWFVWKKFGGKLKSLTG